MKFIELFCGIGGFRYGLETIRWTRLEGHRDNADTSSRESFQCVWANDIDKYACQVYRYRFGTGELYEGDIRAVDPATIPDHDLIVGGFPCQSFSIAGKRGGFEDTRGTLFFEICRIARAKRTKYLFLENVKGLLNHNQGKTFETIIRTLDELGYDCEWQVLNSKNYGVPQNRERVFIIGHLRGERRFQVFPIGETNGTYNESYERGSEETPTGYCVQSEYRYPQSTSRDSRVDTSLDEDISAVSSDRENLMVVDMSHIRQEGELREYENFSPALNTVGGGGHLPMVMQWVRTEKGKEERRKSQAKGKDYTPFSDGCRELKPSDKEVMGCITNAINKDTLLGIPETAQALQTDGQLRTGTSWGTNKPQSAMSIRRLTPVECERLQGFKDSWTKYGIDKNGKEVLISDSQRYKMCGNAVTTNVITAIGEKLVKKG